MQYQTHHYDIVIIGAGGAGLRAAVAAATLGRRVAVISKVAPTRSHTVAAQGGINAALGNRVADDWKWHAYDTLKGSDFLADEDAVNILCEHAPAAIIELEQMGMPFTRDAKGLIYQRAYGGQRTDFGQGGLAYRACAVADRTGHALLATLYGQALKMGVQFFAETIALDLVMNTDQVCCGVSAWRLETGSLEMFYGNATIIATGGFGQIFEATTSSSICTGDGGGMALRAGIPLADMEFIQFHPTSLYGVGMLITEGARGEGASLLNKNGERFMAQYAPEQMELASRDIISRAMMQEIAEGRGAGEGGDHLWLDVRHLPRDVVEHKLPAVKEICRTFARIDPMKDLIPVLPAVHFTMGGIRTDIQGRVVTHDAQVMHNLYAIGEAACASVHGANRLGCNALLELVVFGKRVGEQAALHEDIPRSPTHAEESVIHFDAIRHKKGRLRPVYFKREMKRIMQNHANIFRDGEVLHKGLIEMQTLFRQFETEMGVGDSSLLWNNTLLEAVEVDNMLRQAIACLAAANARTESRGAHFRRDFPTRNDQDWKKHSMVRLAPDATYHISYTPIRSWQGC